MHVAAACRPAAELASFWNKPIVSWVATDPEFNDKTVYTTLGRTLGPFNKMGTFLAEVFQQYNWRKVVVISSNFFLWLDAGKAIRKVNMGNFCCHVYRFCVLFCFSFTGSCGCFLSRALLSGSHCVMSRCMSCCTSWANKDVCMYVCCHCCLVFFFDGLHTVIYFILSLSHQQKCWMLIGWNGVTWSATQLTVRCGLEHHSGTCLPFRHPERWWTGTAADPVYGCSLVPILTMTLPTRLLTNDVKTSGMRSCEWRSFQAHRVTQWPHVTCSVWLACSITP